MPYSIPCKESISFETLASMLCAALAVLKSYLLGRYFIYVFDIDVNKLVQKLQDLPRSKWKLLVTRTKIMTMTPFNTLFKISESNGLLPIKLLRQKATTLLALLRMCGLCDLPRAVIFRLSQNVSQCRSKLDYGFLWC